MRIRIGPMKKNGDITNDNQLIANSSNNYFFEFGGILAKDITPKYDPLKHIKHDNSPLSIPWITKDEIEHIIMS